MHSRGCNKESGEKILTVSAYRAFMCIRSLYSTSSISFCIFIRSYDRLGVGHVGLSLTSKTASLRNVTLDVRLANMINLLTG